MRPRILRTPSRVDVGIDPYNLTHFRPYAVGSIHESTAQGIVNSEKVIGVPKGTTVGEDEEHPPVGFAPTRGECTHEVF